MSEDLPPFDADIATLLDTERASADPDTETQARVGAAVASTLGLPLLFGAAGAATVGAAGTAHAAGALAGQTAGTATGAATAGTATGAAGAVTATGAAVATTATTATTATAATGAAVTAFIAKPLIIGVFAAGALAGGGTVAVVQPIVTPPKVIYVPSPKLPAGKAALVERLETPEAPTPVPAPVQPEAAPKAVHQNSRAKNSRAKNSRAKNSRAKNSRAKHRQFPLVSPVGGGIEAPSVAAVPSPQAEPTVRSGKERSLQKERVLLERARTALGRGQPKSALIALSEHKKRFANGQLSEERQALRILALVGLGRGEDAQNVAKAFAVTYPKSLFLPVVHSALQ